MERKGQQQGPVEKITKVAVHRSDQPHPYKKETRGRTRMRMTTRSGIFVQDGNNGMEKVIREVSHSRSSSKEWTTVKKEAMF